MQEMDVARLKELLCAGDPVTVLDIREADEYASWHIEGSTNVPVYEALSRNDDRALVSASGSLPKDRPVVTVCRGGFVSRRAALLLGSLGYEAFSLAGGMYDWGGVWTEARVPSAAGSTFLQIRRNAKGCLSYLLGSDGVAAVVDPSVEPEAYRTLAHREGLEITHVIETHVHADHISRARMLAGATGAALLLPPNDRVTYPYTPFPDGTSIQVGRTRIEAVATPGHTGESTCYLVDGQALVTGDTLFVDAVGRPDLERGDAGAESGARALYDSLRRRIFDRFGDLPFYPCHHAQPIGYEPDPVASQLARVRQDLPLLQAGPEIFVERVVASLSAKPPNHHAIIAINEGQAELGDQDLLDLEAGPNRCAAGG